MSKDEHASLPVNITWVSLIKFVASPADHNILEVPSGYTSTTPRTAAIFHEAYPGDIDWEARVFVLGHLYDTGLEKNTRGGMRGKCRELATHTAPSVFF